MAKNSKSLVAHPLSTFAAFVAVGLVLLQTSCTVGPDYTAPKTPVRSAYANAVVTTRPSTVSSEAEPAIEWWTTLRDSELDSLVRRAAGGNLDLQSAAARLLESRAELRIAGAKELPTLSTSAAFARINSGKGVGLPGGSSGQSSAIDTNVWSAGFDASWEIDLFGGQRRLIEAASADYQASVEYRRDILVSLTAEVARDYLQLRGLQERVQIARDNLALQQDTLDLTLSLRKAGFNSQLDVSRARTQVAQTRATLSPLTTAVIQQEHAIATLLGLDPNALSAELDEVKPLPAVPALVSVGMPTDLLRRRPDIRRAERQIAAANARVGAAVADFYPRFSLTGDFGLDASKFNHLFDWENRYFILYPSIDWRVFDFGRTAAEVAQEKAVRQETLLAYQSAVLSALRDVEDALVAYANEQDHHAALTEAVASAQDSVAISKDQYKQGIIDFLQLLDAQRQLLSVQDDLAQSDQAIATNLVALYKSLGGGWEAEDTGQRQSQPNVDVPAAIGLSALTNGASEDK